MTDNGFRDRRIRPLCHPSGRATVAETGDRGSRARLGLLSPSRSPASPSPRQGGEGGIRTLEAGISPPNALAGRRLQPLGHFSADGAGYQRHFAATAPRKTKTPGGGVFAAGAGGGMRGKPARAILHAHAGDSSPRRV